MDALDIYYILWENDTNSFDSRVPSNDALENRINQLVALNDLDPSAYPLGE